MLSFLKNNLENNVEEKTVLHEVDTGKRTITIVDEKSEKGEGYTNPNAGRSADSVTLSDVSTAVMNVVKAGVDPADVVKVLEGLAEGGVSRGQPLMKPGYEDDLGFYRNSFGHAGKRLHSEIFLKRGVIADLRTYAKRILPAKSHSASNYVVTDSNLSSLLADDIVAGIRAAGISCEKIVIPADVADESGQTSTEPYKNKVVFHEVVDQILDSGISKNSCIVSVGGGVVNNLCGVVAGMLYRGISLVHFTTTTMGMLDAALDFKQAINHRCGKNLLGCYYPASAIVIDPDCCSSLSTRHVRNGIAEALKHGFTQSPDMVDMIAAPVAVRGMAQLHDGAYLTAVCKHCIEIKTPTLDHYASSDFNEMCPQYGHAVGHAVEHLSWRQGHVPLLHGEAVAIGMCVSAEIALARGLCDEACVAAHYETMAQVGLPAHVPASMAVEDILAEMRYDKHFVGGRPSMGLLRRVGEMAPPGNGSFAHLIETAEIEAALSANVVARELTQASPLELK
jgi:3-dehydroquinate synthase